MSAFLHDHQGPRPHSPMTPQHKETGSNKRNHSPNKSQSNIRTEHITHQASTLHQARKKNCAFRRDPCSGNDPLSHRIIEKRRRDRMNNCLADLSRLIPTYYTKKGRGRIEKT